MGSLRRRLPVQHKGRMVRERSHRSHLRLYLRTVKLESTYGFTPELPDVFYALLLLEIQAQPDLEEEMGQNRIADLALRAFGVPTGMMVANAVGGPVGYLMGLGFKVAAELAPPPKRLLRAAAELLAKDPDSNYEALCRSALLHMVWGDLEEAEEKINVAKFNRDEHAFAHHAYGLLKGLQGDRRGARFELYLAHQREAHHEVRERIEQALSVLERVE